MGVKREEKQQYGECDSLNAPSTFSILPQFKLYSACARRRLQSVLQILNCVVLPHFLFRWERDWRTAAPQAHAQTNTKHRCSTLCLTNSPPRNAYTATNTFFFFFFLQHIQSMHTFHMPYSELLTRTFWTPQRMSDGLKSTGLYSHLQSAHVRLCCVSKTA